jgi:hypothetical protein
MFIYLITFWHFVRSSYKLCSFLIFAAAIIRRVSKVSVHLTSGTSAGPVSLLDRVFTRIIWWSLSAPFCDADNLRSKFRDIPFVEARVDVGHTHPLAAGGRSSAGSKPSGFSFRFASHVNLQLYCVQMSLADQRYKRMGYRSVFWAKDMSTPAQFDIVPEDALVSLVDVDYYPDMPSWLTSKPWRNKPHLLYTNTPLSAGSTGVNNTSYCFNANNELVARVSGGGEYTHQLWDWNHDCIIVRKRYFRWLPITYCCVYLVERRTHDENSDRSLILLTPLGEWRWWCAWLTGFITGKELQRLKVTSDGFVRFQIIRADGMYVTTGKTGSYTSTTIPVGVDDAIRSYAATKHVQLTLADIRSMANLDSLKAAILLEYYRATLPRPCPVVIAPERGVHSFSFNFDPSQISKPMIQSYMSPIIDGCWAPTRTPGNVVRCVKGRITNLQKELVVPPKKLEQLFIFMDEFIELFAGDAKHTLDPVDPATIYDRQPRPNQRSILDRAVLCNDIYNGRDRPPMDMSMKAEAYDGPNDPRPITVPNGVDKYEYSAFMYSFSDHLKNMHWYAFGKTPFDIAERVTYLCGNAKWIVASDASRWDGRLSALLRIFEERLYVNVQT